MALAALAAAALFSTPILADDWVATKLRGPVMMFVDGDWQKLKRGDAVPDDRVIRTLRGGRVTFERGNETVELAGDTQVQIIDRTGRKFTTVKQYFGTVAVEADVRQVQHFAVQTPYLAAVVKGTRFTVSSGERGAKVEVDRGRVAVEDRDTRQSTTVAAGQSAASTTGAPLEVSGRGELPVVYGANGKAVAGGADGTVSPRQAAAAAREAALAAGASAKEAEKAAKEAAREARGESKEAAKESREAAKESKKDSGGSSDSNGKSGGNSTTSGSNSGSSSESDGSGKGKKDKD